MIRRIEKVLPCWSGRLHSAALTCASIACISVALVFIASRAASGQITPPANATLRVNGKVERQLVLSEADLQALPHKHLAVTDEKGTPVTYDGVPVVELLRRAGVPLGKQLRGPQMKLYVIADAADGYRVVFALPEFDPDFTDRVIIVADRRDGHVLAPPEGPFRLIVPGEKRHARWVREVTALDIEEAR
jgi:DMSO/TMAO reductase YedYZ molybdopterin-dependent catalytic subunit